MVIYDDVYRLETYICDIRANMIDKGKVERPTWMKQIVGIDVFGKVFEYPVIRAYFNLSLIYRLARMGLSDTTIWENMYNCGGDAANTNKYTNQIMSLFEEEQDKKDIGEFVSNLFMRCGQFLENKVSHDISYFDLFEVTTKDQEAHDIIVKGKMVDASMSPYQIMMVKQKVLKLLVDIVNRHKLEPFYSFIKSKSCMRIPQFVDCFGLIGANPNEETVIPYLVEESWCRGIQTKDSFFVQASTARVAKILEKCKIAPTGSALKDSMFVNKGLMVKDGDCGTRHMLNIYISDMIDLKAHVGMNWSLDEDADTYSVLSIDDTHLIGTSIYIRTPATCAFIDGDSLCSTCVGIRVRKKFDLGLDCALKINGDAGQTVLSAKHINILVAMRHIKEEFTKYINNTIYNKLDIKDAVEAIYLVTKNDVGNKYESDILECVLTTGESVTVSIMDTVVSVFKNNVDIDGRVKDMDLIYITNKNNPKSKLFNIIMSLVGVKQDDKAQYEEIVSKLYSACRENYHAVQIYTFICRHLRNPKNVYERFDFKNRHIGMNDGVFVSVEQLTKLQPLNESLPHGKSVIENYISTPASFDGTRPSSSVMDVILIPRNKDAIVKLINKYDAKKASEISED